jgi:ABC-type transport system involved in cytochrome c biogenesis permease subunit
MEIKYSILAVIIYIAIAAYLLAAISQFLCFRRTGYTFFTAAFTISLAAFVYRWFEVRHVPLQNLFELFIAMGAAVFILSVLCEKFLEINQRFFDMLLGAIVLFPAGFIFSQASQQLPPALQSPFFVPHVAAYMFAYILLFKAGISAFQTWFAKPQNRLIKDIYTYRLIRAGFPLLTLGLILGSVWAQFAWCDFWGWDPKEMWSLATFLVYVGYFHFRVMFKQKYVRINSLWAVAGSATIIITLLWVNLSRIFSSLHSYAI